MVFSMKSFLDRELFENLVKKLELTVKLRTFMEHERPPGGPPPLVWAMLETQDFAGDLMKLLEGGCYLDHYRHSTPAPGTSIALFGCDGVPVVNQQGLARARVERRVQAAAEPEVELLLDLFGNGPPAKALAAVRAFYDALAARGIPSIEVGRHFARPAPEPAEVPVSPPPTS